jgi:hypothetical protein
MKKQQAPVAHGSGEHTPLAGDASTDPAGHAVLGPTTLHILVIVSQHAFGPHGFGAHVVPIPRNAPLGKTIVHPLGLVMMHKLVIGSQHAPSHGSGVHAVPTPLKVPVHPDASDGTQPPTPATQHAPASAVHGFGEHVLPLPRNVPGVPAQLTCALTVHATGRPEQHAPRHETLMQLTCTP